MEKWLMIVNLGKFDKYYMVRRDKLEEVKNAVNKLIDGFEEIVPPMSVEDWVSNGIEMVFDKDIVEPTKIGFKILRVVEI